MAKRVREITGGVGVSVVYDSVGKDTFQGSIDSLKRRGLLVCVGTASGPIPPIEAMQLAIKGSLFVTRPALADYIADPAEKSELAGELFEHVAAGRIRIEINQRYKLEDAAQAQPRSRRAQDNRVFDLRDLTQETRNPRASGDGRPRGEEEKRGHCKSGCSDKRTRASA